MRRYILTLAFLVLASAVSAQFAQGTIGPRPVPVAHGGTNAATEASARTNLDVYNKAETEQLAAGDTVDLRVSQDSGGDLTVACALYVAKVQ